MPIQTTYPFTHDLVLKGMKAQGGACESITAYSDEVIEFGFGVVYDGEANLEQRPQVKIPDATGQTFLGIAAHTHKQSNSGDDGLGVLVSTGTTRYEIGDDIKVWTKGRYMVFAEQAVNPTLDVYLRHTTNTTESPGDFRVDADTARADQITNAKWVSVTSAAGNAILEINEP